MATLFKFGRYGRRAPAPLVADGYIHVSNEFSDAPHERGVMPPMEYQLRIAHKGEERGEWAIQLTETEMLRTVEQWMKYLNEHRAHIEREQRRKAVAT